MKRLLLLSLVSFAFFFANGQALQLQRPGKGEVFVPFSSQRIEWQYANVDNIKIEVSADSARTWTVIQSSYPASAGYYDWTVISKPSDSCFIRISDVANLTVQSSNYPNNPFIISKPTFKIDPVPALVNGKTPLPISWTSSGIQNISLFVTYDNFKSYQLIVYKIPAERSFFNWAVKDTVASNCFIIIQSVDNSELIDTIKQPFTIDKLPTATGAKYRGGSYDGHSSSTNKAKALQLSGPNTREELSSNTTYPITWTSSSIDKVDIDYSIDNGTSWTNIAKGILAPLSTYNWSVPATPTSTGLVKISDAADSTLFDVSDSAFTIKGNTLKFVSPAKNEIVFRNQPLPLSWSSKGISKINTEYKEGSVWKTIATGVNAVNGLFNWPIPSAIEDSIQLRISDLDNSSVFDTLSKIFVRSMPGISLAKYRGGSYDGHSSATNKGASLRLLMPNGNFQIASGVPYQITWISSAVSKVDLAFSSDGGLSWQNIASSITNSDSYSWTVPGIASSQCLIRIRSFEDSTISDTSDSVFTILAKSIDLVTDTTGTNYIGTPILLEWTQLGIEKVSLEYKTATSASWQTIVTNLPSTRGAYNWVIPSITADSLWVRISDLSNSEVSDQQLLAGKFKTLLIATTAKYRGGSFDGHTSRSTNNKIRITKPAANDTLKSGSTFPITWNPGNVTDTVTLQYSLDSGRTWINIVNTAAGNGVYEWTVPSDNSGESPSNRAAFRSASNILSEKCLVRAVATNTGDEIVGITSNTFSIERAAILPPNYYWVGGSGLWSDYSRHWATTSGGSTFHSRPPAFDNNVYFDANSFNASGQTVTINGPADCNNMIWRAVTNNPNLIITSSNKLTIHGSLIK